MRRLTVAVICATLGFAIAQYEWPGYRARLAGGWLGVLGALALVRLNSGLRSRYPKPPGVRRPPARWLRGLATIGDQVLRRLGRVSPSRPINNELARVEGAVAESLASASGVHRRLRPLVRDIVEDQLAVTSGLHPDRDAGRVASVVGEGVWELIRPDRPYPRDGFAPGMNLRQLADIVDRLERLAEPT